MASRKLYITVASVVVVALRPVSIARYCVFLLAIAGLPQCLPSEPAPKGEKSRDNDLSFRPADMSFKRLNVRPKVESDAGIMPATAVHPTQPRLRPDGTLLTEEYNEHFDGKILSSDWWPTSSVWRIENGRLCGHRAHNHPVWLQRRLPKNARITFTAESDSSDGDLKAEIWGDGRSEATALSYTNATSYLFILGGWKNKFHVLARIDEHAPDRIQRSVTPNSVDPRDRPVLPGAQYRFSIDRNDGRTVHWSVNGLEMASLVDPKPLLGLGHEHLGFNDWEVNACFDDLKIVPLPD
jgi:hypothetical protein